MHQSSISKQYNLEERTLLFSKNAIRLTKNLPKNSINNIMVEQFIRSATSIGANYREANESETKKEFKFRIMICRKEAKETIYWLNLLLELAPAMKDDIMKTIKESTELVKIFAAISNRIGKN